MLDLALELPDYLSRPWHSCPHHLWPSSDQDQKTRLPRYKCSYHVHNMFPNSPQFCSIFSLWHHCQLRETRHWKWQRGSELHQCDLQSSIPNQALKKIDNISVFPCNPCMDNMNKYSNPLVRNWYLLPSCWDPFFLACIGIVWCKTIYLIKYVC